MDLSDNENKDQTGYVAFVKALRTLMATDKSKQYYISAAPQCPLPDASIPVDAMKLMDFVVSNVPTPFSDPYLDMDHTSCNSKFVADGSMYSGFNSITMGIATLANQASSTASPPGAKT